jgi:exonuclease SbcD
MKIGIFSDCHLGPYGDQVNPDGQNARQADMIATLNRIVDGMLAENVDLVLFGGDAFKTARPTPAMVYAFGAALQRFAERACVVCIPGNHDMTKGGEGDALQCLEWLDGVRVYRRPHIVEVAGTGDMVGFVHPGHGGDVQILTLPYPNKHYLMSREEFKGLSPTEVNTKMEELMARMLSDLASKLDPDIPSILLGHLALDLAKAGSDNQFMAERDICLRTADIPDNIDWVFLGHVHKFQRVHRVGEWDIFADNSLSTGHDDEAYVHVLGSTDQVSFGEENEGKYWHLLDTEARTVTAVGTGCRKHQTMWIDAAQGDCTGELPGEGNIVRVRVKLRRGQVFEHEVVRRYLMERGAHSVKFEREYIDDTRSLYSRDSGESESHEDIIQAYCAAREIAGERADALTTAGMQRIREAASV